MKTYNISVTRKNGLGISGFQVEAESAKEAVDKFFEAKDKNDYYDVLAMRIDSEIYVWQHDKDQVL